LCEIFSHSLFHFLCYRLNCQLTSPDIQKDIVQACAEEITQVIMSELGNACFSLLVDESRDVSVKEQMAVMVRLVILSQFFLILP
jgi:hypothetical protein